ncbi:DNA polymerase alpha-associated DNA helicase A [Leucoagaricus sp. SymC.cos]|nr:DNA polymerase alpha-associated DNA helicase A [Leucoagaricus sp. SymC.cos]
MADAALTAFIARQRVLLAKEREAEIERSSLLLSNCGPKLLEQKGLSLGGLGASSINVGLGGKTLVELERPSAYHTSPVFPPHMFKPGDLARIEQNVIGNAPAKKPKKPRSQVSDTRIVIAIDPAEGNSDDLNLPERCRVVKLANSVTYDRMDKAIDHLEKIVEGRSDDKSAQMTPLIQVLLGIHPPSERVPIASLDFFDEKLNPSQKEAIKFCLESPEVACIHGPPGTGKTHTLIEIIRQLTAVTPANSKPQRLLVCGASNLSVDNILERLLALPAQGKSEKLKVTRIGHPARVMAHQGILDNTLEVQATRSDQAVLAKDVKNELEATLNILSGKGKGSKGKAPRGAERKKLWEEVKALRKEYRQREGGVVKSVLSEAQVVLATCHTSGGRQLQNYEFDVVIIDEATQALEAVCWIPIFKAKRLILAGDPMQLPPTIISIDKKKKDKPKKDVKQPSNPPPMAKPVLKPPRTLETTLFDRLEQMYSSRIKKMLEIQYRMHAQICEFPSETLYSSKLQSHESVASHLLDDLPNASLDSEEDAKELLRTPVVFFDTSGCEYFERVDSADRDEGSRCNENEATVVGNWVDKLINAGIVPSQIAIITPYQAQVTLLTSSLRPKYGPELEIGTVDGMQGREKETIIISLVRSNDTREVGFLKEKRRMNVAMTRARRHLCIVGDSSTVTHGGPYLKKWLAWLESNADVKFAGLD